MKRSLVLSCGAVMSVLSFYACSSSDDSMVTPLTRSDAVSEKIVFQDDFNQTDSIPDKTKWGLCKKGSPAWSKYLSESYDQAYVHDGKLVLIAEKVNGVYKTGGVQSLGKAEFQYGKIEICARFDEISLPALKYLGVSAEASQTELLERFRKSVPNAEFVNLYGPTEATIYCTCYRIPASGTCKHYNGMVAIGKPFPGIRVIIVDEEGNDLPQGETGELWVSGRQVMKGYLDDPEKSASALIHRPDGQIYYRTGDLCILDNDGDIIYCGRKDYQVKIQGFRIELSEIEYTAQSFFKTPCNVAALPLICDGICNELHLAVETTECDQNKLIEYLKEKLPQYMLPKQIHCIPQFPVTNSNKTDRKKIVELIKEKEL
jgi:acyl-CoA synthetase (AMP-forming)/AMP-acid ligase II